MFKILRQTHSFPRTKKVTRLQMKWVTNLPDSDHTPFPVIEQEPHFKKVVSYFRTSDWLTVAAWGTVRECFRFDLNFAVILGISCCFLCVGNKKTFSASSTAASSDGSTSAFLYRSWNSLFHAKYLF